MAVSVCVALLFILSVGVVSAAPPNIVVIFLDDSGYGDIGANNNETVETKNIDELAKNGLRFTGVILLVL